MKNNFALILATAFVSNFAFAADAGSTAAERRYAEDRKLCADEPSSSTRMQCLRDARVEYDKATGGMAVQSTGAANVCAGCGKVQSVRVIEKAGEGSTAGMVAGGLAGALLGNQIGKGGTRTVATVAGAAGVPMPARRSRRVRDPPSIGKWSCVSIMVTKRPTASTRTRVSVRVRTSGPAVAASSRAEAVHCR
jgi:uncharacterized protein YcfJ